MTSTRSHPLFDSLSMLDRYVHVPSARASRWPLGTGQGLLGPAKFVRNSPVRWNLFINMARWHLAGVASRSRESLNLESRVAVCPASSWALCSPLSRVQAGRQAARAQRMLLPRAFCRTRPRWCRAEHGCSARLTALLWTLIRDAFRCMRG